MNPNQFQFQEQFENVTKKKNASYFRMRAREFLAGNFWVAFAVAFVSYLLGGSPFSFSFDISGYDISPELGAILVLVTSLLISIAISLFLSAPVRTGYARYGLGLADARKPGFEELFYYFRSGQYLRTVKLGALYTLVMAVSAIPAIVFGVLGIMFLTARNIGATLFGISSELLLATCALASMVLMLISLLFVVIVSYRYYFAFYILADCPDITPRDALRNSATLMKGRKWKLFCLQLSFIGWILLSSIVCVICALIIGDVAFSLGMMFLLPYMATADVAFYDTVSQRSKVEENEFPSLDPEDYDPNLAQW